MIGSVPEQSGLTAMLRRVWRAVVPIEDSRDGPLPAILLALTVVTGLVDAFSYLVLGHVFVANMTGNIVFLAFGLAGAPDFSIPASLLGIVAFIVGAAAGGRLSRLATHRGRLLASAAAVEAALFGTAVVTVTGRDAASEVARFVPIALLAVAMGVQNATARRLAVAAGEIGRAHV